MPDFRITFDTRAYDELDQFALLAHQDYNLGGAGDWFGEWRGGLYGFYARLVGVMIHYWQLHAWTYSPRLPSHIDYHVATLFFSMDSALECLTFAFNAFGFGAHPPGFRDVTDERAQRRISPVDILGEPSRSPPLAALGGYGRLFPRVQQLWQQNRSVIDRIRDLHDISKHRRTNFVGGLGRSDPPEGFDMTLVVGLPPFAEIILKHEPQTPAIHRMQAPVANRELLEELAPLFVNLIDGTGRVGLADAREFIPLKESQFLMPENLSRPGGGAA